MKKTLLATATLSVLLTSGFAFAVEDDSDGVINFIGSVTTAACEVNDLTLNLGKPTVYSLKDAASLGSEFTGDLEFSKCMRTVVGGEDDEVSYEAVKTVSLDILPGTALTGTTNIWASSGTAKNVGVKVNIQSQEVTPAGVEKILANVANEAAFYTVTGQIYSAGEATAGSVRSTLKFKAKYE